MRRDRVQVASRINGAIRMCNQEIGHRDFERFLTLADRAKAEIFDSLLGEIGRAASQIIALKLTNLVVAKYECVHRHTHLLSRPIGLIVDPSNACGLSCPGCVHSKSSRASEVFIWPSGLLSEQNFGRFIQEYGPYAINVIFCNYGEPLINRLTPRFIRTARQYLVETVSSTSLSIKKLDANQLVSSGLDFLTLSIDGATKETYSLYRRQGDFDLVIDNVKRLVAAKQTLNSYTPFLSWQFLMFKHNVHEMEDVKKLAQSIGVNQLRLARPYSVAWDDPSVVVEESTEERAITRVYNFKQAKDHHNKMLAQLEHQVINEHFSRSWVERYEELGCHADRASASTKPTCAYLYKNITMDALGNIMPCCMAPNKDRHLVFSNNKTGGSWNAHMYALARKYFAANDAEYQMETKGLKDAYVPFCSRCSEPTSNSTFSVVVTPVHVKEYLDKVCVSDILSEENKSVLADW